MAFPRGVASALLLLVPLAGCFSPGGNAPPDAAGPDNGAMASPADCTDTTLVSYRDDLASHPGCSIEGLSFAPAQIPGYQCAAKAYPVMSDDPAKPIILLVHGNSDGVGGWEAFEDPSCDPRGATQGQPMLSERLVAAGYRVLAIDMRHDRTPLTGQDPDNCMGATCNVAHSMDHGWGVPLVMHFIRTVLTAYPDRQVSLIGHSFGVTVIRDALRRLYIRDGYAVWPRLKDVILLSGGNHGVSNACGFQECGVNTTMRGRAACQIGNRDAWQPNCWSLALNGSDGAWETPCADGDSAFARTGACGGNHVRYTTIVMSDLPDGAQQDLCVSEQASALKGADNRTIALTSYDESDYFLCGILKNHFGSQRSVEAMDLILARLAE
jgi:pimeloyl-ACP methyl ester carboxylesterase